MMELLQYLDRLQIRYEQHVPLPNKTWIKTGGICACWITPDSVQQMKEVCSYLYQNNIQFDLVGQTSNIFFHSTYNPQVVVSTMNVNHYIINGDILTCDCGVNVVKVAKDCLSMGYAGFYGLVGLPGTVASAAVNNAGCFKCSISSMLVCADILLPNGEIISMMKEDFGYTKRSTVFKRKEVNGVILSVKLKLQRSDNIEEEKKKAEETKEYRKKYQEGYKSNLGSVFAAKKQRRNVRNMIAIVIARTLNVFHIAHFSFIKKRILLLLYRYRGLNRYISDKNINTFVWRDEYAEQAFIRYKQFMSKVYEDLEIEIEERI